MGGDRKVLIRDRIAETVAPLGKLDNRFPALFEDRWLVRPLHETLAQPP
jgi:hypothetical protein